MKAKKTKTYCVGDKAPVSGTYVCVPCGYRKIFHENERFTACTSCMKVVHDITEEEHVTDHTLSRDELVVRNLETWELLKKL